MKVRSLAKRNWLGLLILIVLASGVAGAETPSAPNLKFVCSSAPFVARSLPEANTTRKLFGGRFVAGNRHLPGLPELSVSAQLDRLTVLVVVF